MLKSPFRATSLLYLQPPIFLESGMHLRVPFIELFLLSLVIFVAQTMAEAADSRPRLVVLTDIGGDPDDQQSMIRLMLYSNEFQIEGLIATASGIPGELKKAVVRPDLIRQI